MSLLTIAQKTARLCNISPIPSVAFSSTDPNIQQLVELISQTGVELMERANWRNLKVETSVTGDGITTLFALPSDWKRLCPSSSPQQSPFVSLSRPTVPIMGPVKDEDLNMRKALPMATVFPVWRIIGSNLEVWPALGSGEVVKFWYFSKNWVLDQDTVTKKPDWEADTDTSLINENTIILGAVWRYKQIKGLDYAEAFRAAEMSFARNIAQEDGIRVVQTSYSRPWPDNYWPGVITPPSSP